MVERGPDVWLEEILKCEYLPENDMKQLCEMVKELLMEGMIGFVTCIYNKKELQFNQNPILLRCHLQLRFAGR